MNDEYDWDIYDIFKEQLDIQIPKIEENILNLSKAKLVSQSIDELFRTFHTYKPNTQYLGLDSFHQLVTKVEVVLSSLRDRKASPKAIDDSIIEWLLQALDYMTIWAQEMEHHETQLTSVPPELFKSLQITNHYVKPLDKLKTLNILYIDNNTQRAKKVLPFLKKMTAQSFFAATLNDAKKYIQSGKIHIVLSNIAKDNHSVIDKYQIPIIAIFDKISSLTSKTLLKKGISHTLTNPLTTKAIQRELVSIIKIHFSSANIVIDHKKINTFIQTLQPLPNTIFQILQICDDDEIPVKELIKVVKTDPIIAANILNIANSPLYGNVALKTIDQAVTKFGKKMIKTLAMSGLYSSLGNINLSAYGITEETFSTVSMTRLALMLKWYAKISIADLSLLSSTALLGNIGQLLISKEIIEKESVDDFQSLCGSTTIQYAEESIISTSTNIISSQILNYWKLPREVIDIISYSDKPSEAPQELQKLCVANYIVYQLVDIKGAIAKEIPDTLLPTLAQYNLNPQPLQKALLSL